MLWPPSREGLRRQLGRLCRLCPRRPAAAMARARACLFLLAAFAGSFAASYLAAGRGRLQQRPWGPRPAAHAVAEDSARLRRFPARGLFEPAARPASTAALRCLPAAGGAPAYLPLAIGISCVHCGSSSLAAVSPANNHPSATIRPVTTDRFRCVAGWHSLQYLTAHPQLSSGSVKEHHFFPYERSIPPLELYAKQFALPLTPSPPGAALSAALPMFGLDFTPGYLSKSAQDPRVISQVAELPEEVRFIVLLKSAKEFIKGRLRSQATRACLTDDECWAPIRRYLNLKTVDVTLKLVKFVLRMMAIVQGKRASTSSCGRGWRSLTVAGSSSCGASFCVFI